MNENIRTKLVEALPEYMIPDWYIKTNSLPRNSSGKVDRKSLSLHEINIVKGPKYEAPRNKIEDILVRIFRQVLNISDAGIDDNFFSLGGDSISALSVSSKMKQKGYNLHVESVVQHQNIRDLANCVMPASSAVNSEECCGDVLQTPILKHFLEMESKNIHHFNQSVILKNRERFNIDDVTATLDILFKEHDMLRGVYSKSKNCLAIKSVGDVSADIEVVEIVSNNDQQSTIEKEISKAQRSINIDEGPLSKFILFKRDECDELLAIIHHFIIDGVSWRIFYEDFILIYQATVRKKNITLREKGSPYKLWAEDQKRYSVPELSTDVHHWSSLKTKYKSCFNFVKASSDELSSSIINYELDQELCNEIISDELHKVYNTGINDVLISALGLALCKWLKMEYVVIDIESHGRAVVNKNIDINRTIGWFTSQYPILLEGRTDDFPAHLVMIKEMLRKVSKFGIDFGILRYMSNLSSNERECLNINPEIKFNYFGNFIEQKYDNNITMSPCLIDNVSETTHFDHVLGLNVFLVNNAFTLHVNYLGAAISGNDIYKFINIYEYYLRKVVCSRLQ